MMLKLMGREDLICDGIDTQTETCNTDPCTHACGDLNTASFYAALGVGSRSEVNCNENNKCVLTCFETNKVPVIEVQLLWDGEILCDTGTNQWTLDAAKQAFVCQELACNNIFDLSANVTVDASVSDVCFANDCALNCTDPAFFPQPDSSINCNNWATYETFLNDNGILCTESECGLIEHTAWWAGVSGTFSADCDATTCQLSCLDAEKVPSFDGVVSCTGGAWDSGIKLLFYFLRNFLDR